jgi:hypothetical protein
MAEIPLMDAKPAEGFATPAILSRPHYGKLS